MNEPKKPPRPFRVEPGESPYAALARELANNPNSPTSLRLMSHMNEALRPRTQAANELTEALAALLSAPDSDAAKDRVIRARADWEAVTGEALDASSEAQFQEDARALVAWRSKRPPEIETILADTAGRIDAGYELGASLNGLRGTWHRLWAALVLLEQFGPDPVETVEQAAQTLRSELEAQLGRPMVKVEWDALRTHAAARARQLSR